MQQLYDILHLIRLQLDSQSNLTRQDREFAVESAAPLGFAANDLQQLIGEVENALSRRTNPSETPDHD